jgi:hypothetical protein
MPGGRWSPPGRPTVRGGSPGSPASWPKPGIPGYFAIAERRIAEARNRTPFLDIRRWQVDDRSRRRLLKIGPKVMEQKALPDHARGKPGPKIVELGELEKAKIVEYIKGGGGRIMACELLNIHSRRFYRAMKNDPDFRLVVESAEKMKDEIAFSVIYNGFSQSSDPGAAAIWIGLRLKVIAMKNGLAEARKNRELEEKKIALMAGGHREEGRPDFSHLGDDELEVFARYYAGDDMTDAEFALVAKIGRRVLRPGIGVSEPGDLGRRAGGGAGLPL